jgi:hypothetical protein
MTATPPVDEDDWSDDQWLAWLAETAADRPSSQSAVSRRAPARSFGQAMLAGGLVGIHEALYGPREEEPALVMQADEPGPDGMAVHLDAEDPKASWVRLAWNPPSPGP